MTQILPIWSDWKEQCEPAGCTLVLTGGEISKPISWFGILPPIENKEKVDFILYQMKLVLARQDYIRTQILSRKISKRAISEKGLE